MKKLFDRSNFISSELDEKANRQSLFVSILLAALFAITSFAFVTAFYAFVDVAGSFVSSSTDVMIKDLLRSIPLILVVFMSIWGLLLLHACYRHVSDEKFHKSLFKDAICIICFGGVNILYVIIGVIIGKFYSIAEGSPTLLYPLDTVFISLIYIAIAVLLILYIKKWEVNHPYVMDNSRGNIVKKVRWLYCVGLSIFLIVCLFSFAGCLYSIFIYDFKHGYVFFGIMTILMYFLPPTILGIWEFYYNNLKEDKKKELLLPLSIISTCASVLVIGLYFLALGLDVDAPSNAGFGMYPVAFAASTNLGTFIVLLSPLVFSITALVKGIIFTKK